MSQSLRTAQASMEFELLHNYYGVYLVHIPCLAVQLDDYEKIKCINSSLCELHAHYSETQVARFILRI